VSDEYFAWLKANYAEDLHEIEELIIQKGRRKLPKKEKDEIENKLFRKTTDIFHRERQFPNFLRFYLEAREIDKDWLIDWWNKNGKDKEKNYIKKEKELLKKFLPYPPSLEIFSPGSWSLQINIKLRKPYLSRDDNDFYFMDNPVKRDVVFKIPYVSPTQWKGLLRSALVRNLEQWWQNKNKSREVNDLFIRKRLQIVRMCGNESEVDLEESETKNISDSETYLDTIGGEKLAVEYRNRLRKHTESGYYAGRLHFYPTFFWSSPEMEVINPHDRFTGTGKRPIYFESVPKEENGQFSLLYMPLTGDKDSYLSEALEDLEMAVEALEKMLLVYGFGAKTSSGFGVIDDKEQQGKLRFRIKEVETGGEESKEPEKDNIPEEFRKYLTDGQKVKPQFLDEQGELLSNNEYKKKAPSGGGSLNEYKRFRRWYKKDFWEKSNLEYREVRESNLETVKSFVNFADLKQKIEEPGVK